MKNEILFRKVENEKMTLEDMMSDPTATLSDEAPAGMSGGLPSVSVGSIEEPKDIAAVKILSEPVIEESKKQPGKFYAWAEVQLLYPHTGYDSQNQEVVDLEKGAKARMNFLRHANLKNWLEKNKPIKDRSFIIGTLGRVKTKKGSAFDYRIKEITGQAI